MSRISLVHYIKLTIRSGLFLAAAVLYIINRIQGNTYYFGVGKAVTILIAVCFILFTVEMIFRFFPSRLESMGCQKQFKRNFQVTGKAYEQKRFPKSVFWVLISWLLLNGAIAALYYVGIIDGGILVLISLAYSVCDMVCILFFCPFQTWFMKNKCCTCCRIYNWDYAMMFTPLLFVNHIAAKGLFFLAMILVVRWELTAFFHPERFSEETNSCLSCVNCKEKLCHHKTQLQHFLKEQHLYDKLLNRKKR